MTRILALVAIASFLAACAHAPCTKIGDKCVYVPAEGYLVVNGKVMKGNNR